MSMGFKDTQRQKCYKNTGNDKHYSAAIRK